MDGAHQDSTAGTANGLPSVPMQRFRAVSGPARAAALLIPAATVGNALITVSDWRDYLVVHAYRAGTATVADLRAADTFALWVSIPQVVLYAAAGAVFLLWLWRARCNAELYGPRTAQRRARGWVIGGWFAPIANLWLPHQVVTDIWRASAPRSPAPRGPVTAWWALFVADTLLSRSMGHYYLAKKVTESSLRHAAALSTVCATLDLAAAVLIVVLLTRITAWQNRRHTPATG
ncbi:DUF4328 domain-containing protein [Streptomyces catenulae]|uniref:DUF4328 domain-containing protein n=1 Tax=Streptomyces catenulae TaxID=66875 RepID=A0ABV2YS67_9ACTN|nr:DUF4328 domain-containing protein [Streptomyces catenulae]